MKAYNKITNEPSEGEAMIGDILFSLDIKFEEQKEIHGLKNDSKSFRIADFYLPKFGVYLEFLGKWDSPEKQQEYKNKMAIYATNNIPCIYIFPDNLGAFSWIFRERLRAELLRHKKYSLLWKYEIWKYLKIAWPLFLVVILMFLFPLNIWISIGYLAFVLTITIYCIIGILKRHARIKKRHNIT